MKPDAVLFGAIAGHHTEIREMMERKRGKNLIIVCGSLELGGAERVISVLAPRFLEDFDNVTIMPFYDRPSFYRIDSRIKIVPFKHQCGKIKGIVNNRNWFRKYLSDNGVSVVLSFLTPFNILTSVYMWGMDIPLIVANRNDPARDAHKLLRNAVYRKVACITAQSTMNLSSFGKGLQKKIRVIPNPVFLSGDQIGKALRVPKRNRVVSVGRLTKQKNQALLIEAFAAVHEHLPDMRLAIYGDDRGEGKALRELSDRLGLEQVVDFLTATTKIHDEIASARAFVLSSDYEGMPNVLIEAMALGLPAISTRVSGAVDLIDDGRNGFLVDCGDRNALADTMLRLLSSIELQKAVGEEATGIAQRLNINTIYKQWMDMIDSVFEN